MATGIINMQKLYYLIKNNFEKQLVEKTQMTLYFEVVVVFLQHIRIGLERIKWPYHSI
jgi:hypothetical protein